ncbi:hypothetical protein QQ045_026518 [Rhodiola kirilowii]
MKTPWAAVLLLLHITLISKAADGFKSYGSKAANEGAAYCLSWRLAVEANNVRAWRTVPTQCLRHVESYMVGGQYEKDLELIMGQVASFTDEIVLSDDGLDAWIFDVDDTCISNLKYYTRKRFGCDPYDPMGFRAWASVGECPAIPPILGMFNKLVEQGFKVFLVTGRDEETLGYPTIYNLQDQGFVGYERVILRTAENKGQCAADYKSGVRRKLVEEGYRLWGNVGDQWSDLQGEFSGNRTFKLPNPMYFVP